MLAPVVAAFVWFLGTVDLAPVAPPGYARPWSPAGQPGATTRAVVAGGGSRPCSSVPLASGALPCTEGAPMTKTRSKTPGAALAPPEDEPTGPRLVRAIPPAPDIVELLESDSHTIGMGDIVRVTATGAHGTVNETRDDDGKLAFVRLVSYAAPLGANDAGKLPVGAVELVQKRDWPKVRFRNALTSEPYKSLGLRDQALASARIGKHGPDSLAVLVGDFLEKIALDDGGDGSPLLDGTTPRVSLAWNLLDAACGKPVLFRLRPRQEVGLPVVRAGAIAAAALVLKDPELKSRSSPILEGLQRLSESEFHDPENLRALARRVRLELVDDRELRESLSGVLAKAVVPSPLDLGLAGLDLADPPSPLQRGEPVQGLPRLVGRALRQSVTGEDPRAVADRKSLEKACLGWPWPDGLASAATEAARLARPAEGRSEKRREAAKIAAVGLAVLVRSHAPELGRRTTPPSELSRWARAAWWVLDGPKFLAETCQGSTRIDRFGRELAATEHLGPEERDRLTARVEELARDLLGLDQGDEAGAKPVPAGALASSGPDRGQAQGQAQAPPVAHVANVQSATEPPKSGTKRDELLEVQEGRFLRNGKLLSFTSGEAQMRSLTTSSATGRLLVALLQNNAPPKGMEGPQLSRARTDLTNALGGGSLEGRGRELRLRQKFRLGPELHSLVHESTRRG